MSTSSSSGGIGVVGLLGVVFVTLKLVGVITWSWWYVTLPFWGGLALVGVIMLVVAISGTLYILAENWVSTLNKKKWR